MEEIVTSIREQIASFQERCTASLYRSRKTLIAMSGIVPQLSASACGSCWDRYANIYYKGFGKPPSKPRFFGTAESICTVPLTKPDWQSKTPEDIQSYLSEKTTGIPLNLTIRRIDGALSEAQKIKRFLETDFLPLPLGSNYEKECEKFKVFLENYSWHRDYNSLIQQKIFDNYEPFVDMNKLGFKVPPHIECETSILVGLDKIENIFIFIDELEKFLRTIEAISEFTDPSSSGTAISEITRICDRFSLVVHQLKKRYDGRSSIAINDEYDVQDLLKALLNIQFDDIRPEEPTPSNVGKSSRMDILLKRERIAIETKMPRKGLNTKKLDEELIIDIGRYPSHPDCNTLVCFVYDPEMRIQNPRGLEDDLKKFSKDTLRIIPIIRS